MAVPMEVMAVELTPDMIEQMQAEAEQAEAERIAKLDAVGQTLESLKDQAVQARLPTDKRWQDDWEQFNGRPLGGYANKQFAADEPDYRRARDNITKPKVMMMTARLADLLFPTNEPNWGLEASPIPDMHDSQALAIDPQTGQPIPPNVLAAAIRKAASERAKNMRGYITDQFAECQYDAHGRDALFQLSLHGTCIIEGPYTRSVKQQAWTTGPDGVATMQKRYVEKPAARYVDLLTFYPQPCRKLAEAEHAFVIDMMTKKKVRALAKQPGFHEGQIKRLLEVEPTLGEALRGSVTRGANGYVPIESAMGGRYPVWKYTGPVPKDGMVAFIGSLMESTADDGLAPLIEEMAESDIDVIYAEVWFSQGIVLKAAPLTLDDDDSLPYHETCLEKDPDNWAGYGVAYWLRDDAISRDSLWQAMLLNAFMSAGPQIGVLKDAISRESGGKVNLSCTAPRTWVLEGDFTDIKQALSVFLIPNVLGGIMPLYEQVGKNADERSLMPLLMQGDTTRSTETSSGIAMLMNSANVAIAMIARDWDDNITRPLVRGFVDWNMKYNPDPLCKGDFDVQPKAASYLLVKDIKAQNMQVGLQLVMSNPALQKRLKADEMGIAMLEMLDIDMSRFLRTDDEVKALEEQEAQNPQQDPEQIKGQAQLTAAQARDKEADAKAMEAQTRQALAQQQMQINARKQSLAEQMGQAELALQQAALLGEQEERQARQFIERLRLEMAEMELVAHGRIEFGRITSEREIAQLEDEQKKFIAGLNTRIKAEEVAQRSQNLQAQVQLERPFRAQ